MEVKVLYRLTAVLADIGYYSVTALETELPCDSGDDGEDMRYKARVICSDLVCGCDMLLGNDEAMHGCLRCDVKEGVALVVLVDLLRGDISVDNGTE